MSLESRDFTFDVWAHYGIFTRPELKIERRSYEVPTHSALRGLLDNIFRHPPMTWKIQNIGILSPIKFCSEKRNEIDKVAKSNGKPIHSDECKQQTTYHLLIKPRYRITARFACTSEGNKNEKETLWKYEAMVKRYLKKCCNNLNVYFGIKECTAYLEPVDPDLQPLDINKDLGRMVFDHMYDDNGNHLGPTFAHYVIKNGIVNYAEMEVESCLVVN